MKILWASPLPPTRSGVSDYAVELLGEFHRKVGVRVVAPPDWQPAENWPFGDEIPVVDSGTEPSPDELQLVHIGNNPYHAWLLPRLALPRSVAVMHDLVLHHLLVETTVAAGCDERYSELLRRAHPTAADALARARELGITGRRDAFLFPATGAMLSHVSGVVVHSHWGRRILEAELSGVPVRRIGLAVADPGSPDGRQLRVGLGVDPESVLLMHLGFLTPEKGMETVLTALAAARDIGVRAHLVIVGEGDEQSRLGSAARALGYGDMVSLTGWVPAEELRQLPAAADLGVVLRTPSAGETSAAALRFLACGTPVAVTGVRQFLEWPEAATPRITPGPSSAADLARLIAEAGDGDGTWSERRGAARAAYVAEHRPQDVADQLVEALEDIAG